MFLKQSTSRNLAVFMTSTSDHIAGKTGLSAGLTIYACKDNGTPAAITPTVTEMDSTNMPGWYSLALTTSHTNTLGDLALHVTGSGADPTDLVRHVVLDLPGIAQTGDNYARLGAPAGASVSADVAAVKSDSGAIKTQTDKLAFTVANQVDANVLDWKSATAPAMTGDAFARLGAPAGASVSADIAAVESNAAAIKAKTDNLPASPADESLIIAATNSLAATLGSPAGASMSADIASVKSDTGSTVTQLGTAGAGLTNIGDTRIAHLDADVSTRLATSGYTAPDNATISAIDVLAAAIKVVTDKLGYTVEDPGESPTRFRFTTGALEQAPSGGGSAPSAATIADAVWDEATADHQAAGSTGLALTDAGSGGNPWNSTLEGSLTAGDLLRVLAAIAAGKTTIAPLGANKADVTFRTITDSADIVAATMDGSERASVTVTP